MKKVVIIGAGHNGLIAALTLARSGYKVEVFERRSKVGGACETETRDCGCRVDVGANTLIALKEDIWKELSGTFSLELVQPNTMLTLHTKVGTHIAHYLTYDVGERIILNMGVERPTTFHHFMIDVARALGLDTSLIHDDGSEAEWPFNNSLSMKKLLAMEYPNVSYEEMLSIIKADAI